MRLSPIKIKLVKLLTAIVKSARHDKNTMATIIAALTLQLDLSNTQIII